MVIAPAIHAVSNDVCAATKPNAIGPPNPPAYTPVCTIALAAAGADGLSRTTANCINPGHDQPSPNPRTVPTASAGVPGTASRASPAAPSAMLPATNAT